jgi:hypothetical protein
MLRVCCDDPRRGGLAGRAPTASADGVASFDPIHSPCGLRAEFIISWKVRRASKAEAKALCPEHVMGYVRAAIDVTWCVCGNHPCWFGEAVDLRFDRLA